MWHWQLHGRHITHHASYSILQRSYSFGPCFNQSSHVTGPRFVTTWGTMHGRIQRLLGEKELWVVQKLCRLSTVLCKASSLRRDITRWLKGGEWAMAYWLLYYALPRPCHCAASFVREWALNARGPLALLSSPHHNQVTWLDLGLSRLEARCMEGYRAY